MPTNDFKPFAVGDNANVQTQADWEVNNSLETGFQAGVAKSAEVNKALRQATSIASAFAQFLVDYGSVDMLDDGDITTLTNNIVTAFSNQFIRKTGDTMTGNLTAPNITASAVVTMGGVGAGRLVAGSDNSGLRSNTAGQIDLYSGNYDVGHWNYNEFYHRGKITPGDYSNFDARYYGKATADGCYVLKSGDTMTGSLTVPAIQVGTPGTASVWIGDNDSGLANSVDGQVDMYANGVFQGYWNTSTFYYKKIVPGDYSNFDGRYPLTDGASYVGFAGRDINQPYLRHAPTDGVVLLATQNWINAYFATANWVNANFAATGWVHQYFVQDVQLGAQVRVSGNLQCPTGCVVTMVDGGDVVDAFGYKPLQIFINGSWRTING